MIAYVWDRNEPLCPVPAEAMLPDASQSGLRMPSDWSPRQPTVSHRRDNHVPRYLYIMVFNADDVIIYIYT